jgi:hypothetical protein
VFGMQNIVVNAVGVSLNPINIIRVIYIADVNWLRSRKYMSITKMLIYLNCSISLKARRRTV